MSNITLTWGGQVIDVEAVSVDISYDCSPASYNLESLSGTHEMTMDFTYARPEVVITGLLKEVKLGGSMRNGNNLAGDIVGLTKSEESKFLQDHNVVYENGELTEGGALAFLQVLFEDKALRKAFIDKIKAVDRSKQKALAAKN